MPISKDVGTGDGPTHLLDRPAALEVRDLEVGFAKAGGLQPIVTGVSFSIRAGETLGVGGESGSGKTVTALASMGLIGHGDGACVTGSVQLGGHELIGRSRK